MKHHHPHHPQQHGVVVQPPVHIICAPQHHDIAYRAYLLWEQRGRPDNNCEAIWLEAESVLVTVLHRN